MYTEDYFFLGSCLMEDFLSIVNILLLAVRQEKKDI